MHRGLGTRKDGESSSRKQEHMFAAGARDDREVVSGERGFCGWAGLVSPSALDSVRKPSDGGCRQTHYRAPSVRQPCAQSSRPQAKQPARADCQQVHLARPHPHALLYALPLRLPHPQAAPQNSASLPQARPKNEVAAASLAPCLSWRRA
eukprot:CAMPEP_0183344468 /NCGR_PEP_ID=MMETSP0164_2-20130417/10143_1 /TAXON_ID=221442 /ORGANISM="Coccolithus pelagicus ssp braarudi, Strain PLY182g" /LENGTH=149 /DNA_ID=CAMNT_0025515469 /DNA_START=114 /DNA_END=564 /DNA_ORIENTATION=+